MHIVETTGTKISRETIDAHHLGQHGGNVIISSSANLSTDLKELFASFNRNVAWINQIGLFLMEIASVIPLVRTLT